ncbi:DHA2 family efflux MFS transporter permease subunit [Actinomadura rubteroloni]|uniref:DHA2 family efflux MFS transporter permease subunit n=1 Tax=Actinomadura rubteroloni TaxID=1926885 RepID=UPI0011B0F120|nr:DHA2 family efflux MFS transporter permease subunit [Actinomadura rubteroloni]
MSDRPPAAPEVQADPKRFTALAVILIAAFMDLLDATIVNVAVPSIQRNLDAGYSALQWTIAAYGLALAVLLITGGRLGDIYGRKRVFLVGMAAFTVSSLACGLAGSPETLIVARLAAGAAAGLMIPQVLAIIHVGFPPQEIGKVIGLYGSITGLAAVLGPVLGGFLVQIDLFGLGWRSVFLVNVPVGVFALVAAARLVRESRSPVPLKADPVGMLLASTGVGLLTYALIEGRARHWPAWSIGAIAAAVVILGVLVAHQVARRRRGGDPLVALGLFRAPGFAAGLLVMLIFTLVISGFAVVWTLFMQSGMGWSPIHAGLTALPYSFAVAVGATVAFKSFVPRLGRRTMMIGALVMASGLALFAGGMAWEGTSFNSLEQAPALLVVGFGMGLIVAPLTNAILSGVPPRDAGSATGLINTAGQLGGAIGVALVGLVFAPALGAPYDYPGHGQTALWWAVAGTAVVFALLFGLPANWMRRQD